MKKQSIATKLALSLSAFGLMLVGIFTTAIGMVDQVWEHTLGLCMVFAAILVAERIEDKRQFAKDIVEFIKEMTK